MHTVAAPTREASRTSTPSVSLVLKRVIDIVLGLIAGLFSLPLIAISALAIKLVDPGPVFFIQPRHGRDGRMFALIKLRTMRHDPMGEWLSNFLAAHPAIGDPRIYRNRADPRIIPKIGALLRRYSIDELPQIWNVICGDLSLVGPRPLPDYHVRLLDAEFQALRSSVRPGITGLWQLEGRGNAGPESLARCDERYLSDWSLGRDVIILGRTVVCVMRGSGV